MKTIPRSVTSICMPVYTSALHLPRLGDQWRIHRSMTSPHEGAERSTLDVEETVRKTRRWHNLTRFFDEVLQRLPLCGNFRVMDASTAPELNDVWYAASEQRFCCKHLRRTCGWLIPPESTGRCESSVPRIGARDPHYERDEIRD